MKHALNAAAARGFVSSGIPAATITATATRHALPALVAAACFAFAAPAGAQQSGVQQSGARAGSPAAAQLDTVVVTASRVEQAIKDAPATISVISREALESGVYLDVVDAVQRQPGVAYVGGGRNDRDISVRGLPGEYTLILIDGRRLNTRETMNRGTAGVQSSFLPPLDAIERIEVVRGPMSSLYGSDAMGGVINIITRKVPKRWSGSVTLGGTVQQESDQGNTGQGEFWLSGPLNGDILGLQVRGKAVNRSEDEIFYPAPLVSGSHDRRERSVGAKLTLKPSSAHEFALDIGHETLEYRRTPGRSIAPAAAATRTEHGHDYIGLTHDGRWRFGTSTISLYRETGDQTNWSNGVVSAVAPEVTNTVLDGLLSLPMTSHHLRLGAQWRTADVEGIGRQDAVAGLPVNVDKVSIDSWALFAEDDFLLTDRFTLTFGARLDHDDRYGSHWSPRLYGVYQLSEAWTLRGGVARGFKAPTVRQSVGGYCMTTGGGTQAQGTLCGNPDLEAETSFTQEIGAAWAPGNGTSLTATLFNNRFRNKVASYDTGVPDPRVTGRSIYVYDNIDRLNLRGLELGLTLPIDRAWTMSGSYTYTKSQRKGGGEIAFNGTSLDGYPLDQTPEHVLNVQLDWKSGGAFDAWTRLNYTGRSQWAAFRNGAVGPRERPSAVTLDLGGRYRINRNLALSAALLNVTNRMVAVDNRARLQGLDGNWMVDEGRRLQLALTGTF